MAGVSPGAAAAFVPILAVVFILSFIAAITEVPVASLLLRDVDSYTLAVGMQQYLNPQNYLWGDLPPPPFFPLFLSPRCSCWRNVGWSMA